VRRGLGGKEESVVEEHGERIGWARDGEPEMLDLNRSIEMRYSSVVEYYNTWLDLKNFTRN
jgi:hypothetical protein